MTAAIGLRHNPSPPDPVEAPDCPEWLSRELHGNAVFVQEAIENNAEGIAKAHATRTDAMTAIEAAVDAWIAHWWEYRQYDAHDISRTWARLAREAA